MPLNVTITVDNEAFQKIRDAIGSIGDAETKKEIANVVIEQAVLPETRNTPPQSGKPQAFTSAAQRRAFFAKLKSGAIRVPYQRTGALVAGWHQSDAYTVANEVPHAAFVVAKQTQAKYHKGNWPTDLDISQKVETTTAEPTATGAMVEWIAKKGLS